MPAPLNSTGRRLRHIVKVRTIPIRTLAIWHLIRRKHITLCIGVLLYMLAVYSTIFVIGFAISGIALRYIIVRGKQMQCIGVLFVLLPCLFVLIRARTATRVVYGSGFRPVFHAVLSASEGRRSMKDVASM